MHHIFFSLKRTHHRALAYSRRLSVPYGLTPARFDMMYAIDRHRDSLLWQSHLRRLLGVTAATISRMVRSLEELGYITRDRNAFDRRQIDIRITKLGSSVFDFVENLTMTTGNVDFIVTGAFAVLWYAESAISDLFDFEAFLHRARDRLWDTATLRYPWHPDDFE
jgi:DNA-binding MarR family transcriptional regulator